MRRYSIKRFCLHQRTVLGYRQRACQYPAGYRMSAYLSIIATRYKVGQLYHPTEVAFCYLRRCKHRRSMLRLVEDREATIDLQSEHFRQPDAIFRTDKVSYNYFKFCRCSNTIDISSHCSRSPPLESVHCCLSQLLLLTSVLFQIYSTR